MGSMSTAEAVAEMARLRETIALASAQAAYARALFPAKGADRLHVNKSLYFALCGDAVKIGVSSDPPARIADLQTGAPGPLKLIATIASAGHLENECHKKLAHLHLHGEWFRYTPEVDSLIGELRR